MFIDVVHVRLTESLIHNLAPALNRRVQGPIWRRYFGESSFLLFLMQNKTLLRQQLRSLRKHLSPKAQHQAAKQLSKQLQRLPELKLAKHIAAYWPIDGEINPLPFLHTLQQQKHLYLPKILTNGKLRFNQAHLSQRMFNNGFGIAEPISRGFRPAQQLDVVLMPLVGFDNLGNRLGMGKGFYDKTLAFKQRQVWRKKPLLIGIAHDFQEVPRLHPSSWDIPLNMIITNKKKLRF